MIEIDGSFGEGGGQILRTALGLSCLFTKPFRIFNLRKGRSKPGLRPQHLTSVKAARTIARAEVSGDAVGSTEVVFSPQAVKPGHYTFDIGTAGSVSLVLQTVLPALAFADGPSTVSLTGGTHVPWSPSFDYLRDVFAPMLQRLGIGLSCSIEAYGFYPRGGGRVQASIVPVKDVRDMKAEARGAIRTVRGRSAVGNLPLSIAERQRTAFTATLHRRAELKGETGLSLEEVPAVGQGTFLFATVESEHGAAGFCGLGARGKRAEKVGDEAAEELADYLATGAALDPHLADQIVIYLALARGESAFTTSRVTNHLLTNLWAMAFFHSFESRVDGEIGKPGRVVIVGSQ